MLDKFGNRAGSAEPVGGIARFQSLVNHYRSARQFKDQPVLLTLFSGDAFNPSLESSVTKGRHMVPILNGLGVDVACVGVIPSSHAVLLPHSSLSFRSQNFINARSSPEPYRQQLEPK